MIKIDPVRVLVVGHRWLGVALCLMFAVWFASGAIMIYVPFPALPERDRLAHVAPIDFERVAVSPEQAVAAAGAADIDRLRLIQSATGPVYVVEPTGAPVIAIDAHVGAILPTLSPAEAASVGALFGAAAAVEGPFDYDQWVVHQRFDPFRPVYRIALSDAEATEIYVSARSGDVLQRTTRTGRAWNYAGAVAHWLYPTILRKSWWLWDKTVWTLSLIGVAMSLAGLVLGVLRSSKSLRSPRKPAWSAFRGWMRWHHVTGLIGGIFLITWIFSGWLSMDHARLFSTGVASAEQISRYRGLTLAAASSRISLAQLQMLGRISEAEIVALAGQAYALGRRADAVEPVIRRAGPTSAPAAAFTDQDLEAAVHAAWPDQAIAAIDSIPADDSYGRLITDPMPGAVRRVTLGDEPPTWIHIDAESGRVVQVMDRSRRLYRWLFAGLHDFDFPALYGHEAIRQALLLALLGAGFLVSVTGVVIGVKRLWRTVTPAYGRQSPTQPSVAE